MMLVTGRSALRAVMKPGARSVWRLQKDLCEDLGIEMHRAPSGDAQLHRTDDTD